MLQSERNSSDDVTWRFINVLGPPTELACGGIKGEAVQEIIFSQNAYIYNFSATAKIMCKPYYMVEIAMKCTCMYFKVDLTAALYVSS